MSTDPLTQCHDRGYHEYDQGGFCLNCQQHKSMNTIVEVAGKGIRAQIAEDQYKVFPSGSELITRESIEEAMKLLANAPQPTERIEFPIRYFADGYHWQITSFSCQRSLDGITWEEAERPEGFAEAVMKALQKRAEQWPRP